MCCYRPPAHLSSARRGGACSHAGVQGCVWPVKVWSKDQGEGASNESLWNEMGTEFETGGGHCTKEGGWACEGNVGGGVGGVALIVSAWLLWSACSVYADEIEPSAPLSPRCLGVPQSRHVDQVECAHHAHASLSATRWSVCSLPDTASSTCATAALTCTNPCMHGFEGHAWA